jgi:4-diphosphocytidyl-2-C-methyl-D-erythritol kinase
MTRQALAAGWAEAPAKLNLGLAVVGQRADGYHLLRSVFLRLALHDHLEVRPAPDPDGPDELIVVAQGPGALAPLASPANLVLRAAAALRSDHPEHELPALSFRLEKHIPIAAGLAGGSSDAAAALALAAGAWGLPLRRPELLAVAARVGADVPFFVSGHAAALVGGIGEVVDALPAPQPPPGILLVTPARRLPTAEVFAELDRLAGAPAPAVEWGTAGTPGRPVEAVDALAAELRVGLSGAGLADLAPTLRDANDLWPAASRLLPGLHAARSDLEARLARAVLLSGSGPTLVAVYPSMADAAEAASQLERDRGPRLADATITATSSSPRGGSA